MGVFIVLFDSENIDFEFLVFSSWLVDWAHSFYGEWTIVDGESRYDENRVVFGSKESVPETEVEQNEGVKTTLETTKRRHVQKLLNGMSDNDFEASTVSRTMNDTSPFSSPIDWSSRSGSRTRHALYSTCASCW